MNDAPVAQATDGELAGAAMERRFQLVEEIAIIQGKHKGELEPLLEEVKVCETFIKDFMNNGNMQQYKIASGAQAFFQNGARVSAEEHEKVLDYLIDVPPIPGLEAHWDSIKKHIRAAGNWNILTKAVKKEAVLEYVEVNKVPPPGVKLDTLRELQWRKGRS